VLRAPVQVHRVAPAAEYDKLHRPYAPLPASEKLPTMSENWTCVAALCCAALRCVRCAPRCRCRARPSAACVLCLRALTRRAGVRRANSYAMRRYSRFSGYAWAAALGVGLVVWGGHKLGESSAPPPPPPQPPAPSGDRAAAK
jgi:hypothetical protein